MRSTLAKRLCLLLVLSLSIPVLASGASKSVRSVEIHSRWGGLGPPQNADVNIQSKNGSFVCNGKGVRCQLVKALVEALEAPSLPKPDMANLAATREWLRAQVASKRRAASAQAATGTPSQQQFFISSFTNPELIAKVIPDLFSSWRSDDYPSVDVKVEHEDGTVLKASSRSSHVYMLPWSVGAESGESYNAAVSRAVSALLPANAVNKGRLAGNSFPAELADAVMRFVKTEWNMRGTEDQAGGALNTLRGSYDVLSAEITPWHGAEYGTATHKGEPEEKNLHAEVRKPGFPPMVADALVLKYVNGSIEGLQRFLETAGKYEQLALSVGWLKEYIQEHPRVSVRISYVHDASFGDKAMRTFTADMKEHGREDLVGQARAQRSDIALLMIGNRYAESYWLIFPDKHALLWRYDGPSGLLKWGPADFPPGQCSEYRSNYGGCSGREVAPDGTLGVANIPRDQVCMALQHNQPRDPSPPAEELFPVMDHGRGGFIDQTGRVIIPLCFDKVGAFSEGMARFERDGSWGFINRSGAVVIESKFPWAEEFSEGLARVQLSGLPLGVNARWGFIDSSGKVVVLHDYKGSSGGRNNIGADSSDDSFHDGRAKVETDGKTGFIDRAGNVVIPFEFTYAYPFSEGLAAATKSSSGDDGWGFIDSTGRWAIAPQFEWGSSFQEHLAPVNRSHKCGYIDPTGVLVLQPPVSADEKDCATVWGDFVDGVARWKGGGKYGFIDRTGKFVIKPQFDLTFHFSEGLAAVKVGKKWGYIDKQGKMVIRPQSLNEAEDFHHGLAFVQTEDGRYGYIDKSGKYVWVPTLLYVN